jgi:hypothetical protein
METATVMIGGSVMEIAAVTP